MSNLEPSVVALDSGLNLQTAKIIAPPGSVLDTINYEQVDFQGQKRIDGYQRYDGSLLGALDEYYVFTFTATPVGAWAPGDVVCTEDRDVVGIVLAVSGLTATLAIINDNYSSSDLTDVALYIVDDVSLVAFPRIVVSYAAGSTLSTVDVHYANLLAYSEILRDKIEHLPGGIIGLQWFRDRLYAVADVATVFLSGATPQVFPQDVLTLTNFPLDTATVLDSFEVDGEGVRVVFLNIQDTTNWYLTGEPVTRGVTPVGSTLDPDFDVPQPASIFESRTEQQAMDEDVTSPDYGWRFKHLGWTVGFEEGLSLFGSLPSTNQNIEGLGVQGPTSTTGNNGRPLTLLQKVNITNDQTQVNGWKSSQTPTTYLLDPDDLTEIDGVYTYADGYISWDGVSGQVSAIGVTSGSLVEYAATATVEVEI